MAFSPQTFGNGLGSILGGLFGNSSKPYDSAMQQYQDYTNRGVQTQQPYQNAGVNALGQYQDWLNGQKDPSKFINDLMGNYNESDYAHNLQQSSMNAAQNAASASGLSGSTPLMQQIQQDAGKISSADQNQWLQNVLGINKQYGEGQNNLVNGGRDSANHLTDLYNQTGGRMGEQTYNREASKQNNFWNTLGGIGSVIGSFF